mgnify:CR=1 FL=1
MRLISKKPRDSFEQDENGHYIFYPSAQASGLVLPSWEYKEKLQKHIDLLLTLCALSPVMLIGAHAYAIPFLIVLFFFWFKKLKNLTTGLEQTSRKRNIPPAGAAQHTIDWPVLVLRILQAVLLIISVSAALAIQSALFGTLQAETPARIFGSVIISIFVAGGFALMFYQCQLGINEKRAGD